ncbi:MAG TPA: type I-U CRISPR-associated protein Csx17, partial [Wenzhouxiangella sp.]|nr:type I-U CRISPR-associated protein Csx17 [Wenzhouxiangella sp.]
MSEERSWEAASREGSRKAQLRRALRLSVEERLQELETLTETARALAGRSIPNDKPDAAHPANRIAQNPTSYDPLSGRNQIALDGCNPLPLSAYLKALGVLRLVAEQIDEEARGFWREDRFILITRLSASELRNFLLRRYRPTPVLAPWNGGSGFYPKDNQAGIQPIEDGAAVRLDRMRNSIDVIRKTLTAMRLDKRPDKDDKTALINALRNELPDPALAWLDAAILLSGENPKYPPLLGTGGNDGRLDFTNNFMQRLVDVIDPDSGEPMAIAGSWLDGALFGHAIPQLTSAAIGQFAPGNAGGPNSAAGFEGGALINPWDFILMIEGALMFAATATRRLESARPGTLSYPFTVRATGAGSGASALADEADSRAEVWLPLWSVPCTLPELRTLFSEGRATLGRQPARDGLDFVRAISKLGVDRGLEGFQRYTFVMRSGKA